MTQWIAIAGAAAAALMPSPAVAGGPLGPHPKVAGERSQVLTIGSFHLGERAGFDPKMLSPLLDRLAAYRPTVITYEGLSGEQCAMMRANPAVYADAVESYCWDPAPAQKESGLTVATASAAVRELLAHWPASPSAGQRRKLASLFLAAGERPSAAVQWLRLPVAERVVGDGIGPAMAELLNRQPHDRQPLKANENIDIVATLAARLGLERVYGVDDHTADAVMTGGPPSFETAMAKHFASFKDSPLLAEHERDLTSLVSPAAVLAYHRKINAAHANDAQVAADFGGALAAGPETRRYVAWWEVRNLRMAANVRAAFAGQPGARVLNIVGSSHKPWYDALAATMSDVDVDDATPILR